MKIKLHDKSLLKMEKGCVLAFFIFGITGLIANAQENLPYVLDVPYVPTPDLVVEEMLKMAEVNHNDVLYDLGSGDGRIPIAAAKKFGIKAVGIELDPSRIREATENAQRAGMVENVHFLQADIFKMDFSEATILTLYLFPEVNLMLRPIILNMKPGTRVISHKYTMGDWEPDEVKVVRIKDAEHILYLWRVPSKASTNFNSEKN